MIDCCQVVERRRKKLRLTNQKRLPSYMQMAKSYSNVARSDHIPILGSYEKINLSGAMPLSTELHKDQLVLVHMQSPVSYL